MMSDGLSTVGSWELWRRNVRGAPVCGRRWQRWQRAIRLLGRRQKLRPAENLHVRTQTSDDHQTWPWMTRWLPAVYLLPWLRRHAPHFSSPTPRQGMS